MPRITVVALLLLVLAACGGAEERSSSGGVPPQGFAEGSLTWGQGEYGIVLAHGAAFDAASWEPQGQAMADRGATVVAVEDISVEGILDAVEDLRSEGIEDIALIGGSAGADSILELASQDPDLADQLILLSPNSVVDGLGEQPKLFVASSEEGVADVSVRLAEAAPGDDNEVRLLPGSAHAQNIFDTGQGEVLLQLILDRIDEFA